MEKTKLPIGTISGVIAKSSKLLKLLKIIKAAKYAKYLITLISMLISAFVYGWKFGIWFGIGLVGLIFIHEMGHVWALKKKGYATKAPVFIPLLGAIIFAPQINSREDESYIGFMGPFIGSIGAVIIFIIWFLLPSKPEILLLLVYIGIWINLFNLIPIRPLDGGRILQCTGTWYKFVGISIVIALIIIMQAPQFIVILILSTIDLVKNIKNRMTINGLLALTMIAAYIVGPGITSEFWFDVCLASFLIGIDCSFNWKRRNRQNLEIEKDQRPFPEKKVKVFWLLKFIILMLTLTGILIYLLPLMPTMK